MTDESPTGDGAPAPPDEDAAESDLVTEPFFAFRIGRIWFAVPAMLIDEICARVEPTPLPLAPEYIPGAINLRGQAVPLLDLQRYLDIPPTDADDGQDDLFARIAVATAGGMRVGIFCDQVRGVVEIARGERRRPVVALGAWLREFVMEEVHHKERLVLLLDLVKLLNAAKVQR